MQTWNQAFWYHGGERNILFVMWLTAQFSSRRTWPLNHSNVFWTPTLCQGLLEGSWQMYSFSGPGAFLGNASLKCKPGKDRRFHLSCIQSSNHIGMFWYSRIKLALLELLGQEAGGRRQEPKLFWLLSLSWYYWAFTIFPGSRYRSELTIVKNSLSHVTYIPVGQCREWNK